MEEAFLGKRWGVKLKMNSKPGPGSTGTKPGRNRTDKQSGTKILAICRPAS